jgi:hypothetical protein
MASSPVEILEGTRIQSEQLFEAALGVKLPDGAVRLIEDFRLLADGRSVHTARTAVGRRIDAHR